MISRATGHDVVVTPLRAALVVAAFVALAANALDWPTWLRMPLTAPWLLVIPGWTWSRRLGLGDRADATIVAVALSSTALTIVGAAMALTRLWSPIGALLLLMAVAVGGALAPWPRRSRPDRQAQEDPCMP